MVVSGGVVYLDGYWQYDEESNELVVSLGQTQPTYTFRIAPVIDIIYDDGSKERLTLELEGNLPVEHRSKVVKSVKEVIPDPDTELLAKWKFVQR